MRAVIPHAGGEIEATCDGETWLVRLGELEEASPYLDYALARLLDVEERQVHQLAAALIRQALVSPTSVSSANEHRGSRYVVLIDGAAERHTYEDARRQIVEREVLLVDGQDVVAEHVTQPKAGGRGVIRARRLPTRGR